MIKEILARLQQGHRTMAWPDGPPPPLPERFRGRPVLDEARCTKGCSRCVSACPTSAISQTSGSTVFDLGRCLFCTDCVDACPAGALSHSPDYRLSTGTRGALLVGPKDGEVDQSALLRRNIHKLFGRSLKLRQVSAGGCNACEADTNVLGTIGWDMGRFGIQIVASPRHADGLLLTGPVTTNMNLALRKTWAAIPEPKVLIVLGACAISGGPFAGNPQVAGGSDGLARGLGTDEPDLEAFPPLPEPDLFVPGCPPHPLTILEGLLRLIGRIKGKKQG